MEYNNLLDKMVKEKGFFRHNKYRIIEANEENIEIKVELNENSMNPYGFAHGAIIFGLGDTVMGMIARSKGRKALTRNANITFLRPGAGKYLLAKGEIVKDGKTACYLRANIYNDKEQLIAAMTSDFYYID